CHGNPVLLEEVVRMAVGQGARIAEPGEFTRRAYLNGRMDLMQAEAVATLIAAGTTRAIELAARELSNGCSTQVMSLRDQILDVQAGLEVAIDFPEDGVGCSRESAVSRLEAIACRLRIVCESGRRGRAITGGVSAMIAGAPNVGKSSLFNALLGRDRAIVSPDAGTTRDMLDGLLSVAGVPLLLQDGAGLGVPKDVVDSEGMRRSQRAIESSDLLLIVLDLSREIAADERHLLLGTAARARLVIGNKSDVAPRAYEFAVD